MPSGPPELHEKWETDGNAIRYLEERGYKLQRGFVWLKPKDHEPTPEENEALNYLCWEWDYGDIVGDVE